MKKFFRKVVKTFKKLSDANFLAFGRNVTSSMAAAVAPVSCSCTGPHRH